MPRPRRRRSRRRAPRRPLPTDTRARLLAPVATELPREGASGPRQAAPGGASVADDGRPRRVPLRPDDSGLPIGPGDLIEVSVLHAPELELVQFRVPQRGIIALPLLGAMVAAGYTAAELEEEIRRRLQETYMHDPQVSVLVVEQLSAESVRARDLRRRGEPPAADTGRSGR
jgi:protein involved in polysaccharide export with SLBB domain